MVSTLSVTFKQIIMTTQSSEQKIQIDNTEKAIDILKKWFEEDKDNRGFIILTSERGEKVDDEYAYGGNTATIGDRSILIAGVEKAMRIPNSPLISIFDTAMQRTFLMGVTEDLRNPENFISLFD